MPLQDILDALLEEKRAFDLKVEHLVEAFGRAKGVRFDLYRNLDKTRTELELASHWVDKAQRTIDEALAKIGK